MSVAMRAPMHWATMNLGTSLSAMPEKVLVNARANVTAGFANDVDAVNQYAAAMYAPTVSGTTDARRPVP